MIYTFRAQAAECFKGVFKFSSRDAAGVENKRLYDNFLGVAMTLGAFSMALGVVKATAAMLAAGTGTPGTIQWKLAGLAGTDGIAGIPPWVVPGAVVAVAAVTALVVLAEMGVLKAAGSLTLSGKFADEIIRVKRNWLASLSLFLTPLVAVWTGANPERDTVIAYLFVIVAIILCGLFFAHSLIAFIRQKVSLLVWFLYLCSVEIFPVCVIVVAATRNL
jgi:hypothetical protein